MSEAGESANVADSPDPVPGTVHLVPGSPTIGDHLTRVYQIPLWRLWWGIVLLILLILAGCTLVFRWTSTRPEDTGYSQPLRTRPPR